MADIFVSYSHADRERVEAIVAALETRGFSVFIDRHLVPGSRFSETLARELAVANAIVVCWSETSAKSHWVADEAGVARDSGRLLPVTIDGAPPPLGFKQFHTIDFSAWRGEADKAPFPSLADAAGALIAGTAYAPPPHPAKMSSRSGPNAILFGGTIAGAALLGLIAFLSLRPEPRASPDSATSASTDENPDVAALGASVAVIPFANVSDDAAHDAFVDGLSDELLVKIATIKGVRVPGRSSCFYFKSKPAPIDEIAAKLGVRYVLEGSVRRSGGALRIAAQLTDAATGYQVWSETYDRTLADIFAVQRDIADQVLGKLPGLLGVTIAADWERDVDPRAHELYLTGLGYMHNRYAGSGWSEAKAAFAKALEIEPDYPLANAYFAVAASIVDGAGALKEITQALKFAADAAPDDANVLFAQGFAAASVGEGSGPDEVKALEFYDRAIAIDPSHSEALHARIRLFKDQREKLDAFKKLIAVDPLFFNARLNYATILAELGRWDESEAEFETIYRLNPDLGRDGPISVARATGRTDELGKFAFAEFSSASIARVERFSVAGLLADFGATDEARWLVAQRDTEGFLFLPRQQEIFLKWLDGDYAGAAKLVSLADYEEMAPHRIFGAVAAVNGREPDLAISLLDRFRPGIESVRADEVSKMPETPDRLAVRLYAIALVMKGETARARPLFDALLAAPSQGAGTIGGQLKPIMRAADLAWSGRNGEALAEVRAARAAHWRYPRTYVIEFSPWPDIDGPYGLLAPLRDDPEFQKIMSEIRAENTALLQSYEEKYGALTRIRAMMAGN